MRNGSDRDLAPQRPPLAAPKPSTAGMPSAFGGNSSFLEEVRQAAIRAQAQRQAEASAGPDQVSCFFSTPDTRPGLCLLGCTEDQTVLLLSSSRRIHPAKEIHQKAASPGCMNLLNKGIFFPATCGCWQDSDTLGFACLSLAQRYLCPSR